MYDTTLGRFLERDAVGYDDSINLYLYVKSNPTDGVDPSGHGPNWSRKLASGPDDLDGDDPDYQVKISHVLPDVPNGATQVWQVVHCNVTWVNDKCKTTTKARNVIDIVAIGGRKEVKDTLGWSVTGKICFAVEQCTHTIGFDDQKSNYARQTSAEVTDKLAADLLSKMTAPKDTFTTEYIFKKAANCNCCAVFFLPLLAALPDGEYLSVGGVGSWRS